MIKIINNDNLFIYGKSDLGKIVNVKRVTRTLTPAKNLRTVQAVDGVLFLGAETEASEITVDCTLISENRAELSNTLNYLASLVNYKTLQPLVLRDYPQTQNIAILSRAREIKRNNTWAEFSLTFYCPAGVREERTATVVRRGEEKNGIRVQANTINISTWEASASCSPIIKIVTKATKNIKLVERNNGKIEYFTMLEKSNSQSFTSGEKITIDCNKKMILANGEQKPEWLTLESKFLEIPPKIGNEQYSYSIVLNSAGGTIEECEVVRKWI